MAFFDIATGTTTVDGGILGIVPGDVVRITAGARGYLVLQNITGSLANPVTVINNGGKVTIITSSWLGIEVNNCQHIRITGTGSADTYGFDMSGWTNAGVFGYKKSRYLELDHLYIHDEGPGYTYGAGIRIYTSIEDSLDDGGWVCYDCSIHDCYIQNTDGCAMYLGNYSDTHRPCDGLEVYDNEIHDTGTDGVQIRQWLNCDIHDNYAENTGVTAHIDLDQPCCAYILSAGCSGSVHDNIAMDCNRGVELDSAASGAATVHHNLIVHSGYKGGMEGSGIRWYNRSAQVYHNTIVDSEFYGIYASDGVTAGAIYNNFIVEWGASCIRANGMDWAAWPGGEVYNNVCTAAIGDADFVDPGNDDYHLQATSPAVGAGYDGSDAGCYPRGSPSASVSPSASASPSSSVSPSAASPSASVSPSASASPSVSPSAPPAATCLDIETADLSQFDSTSTDGGDMFASNAAAMEGSWGVSYLVDDTNIMYGQVDQPDWLRLRVGFYFDINSLTMADYDTLTVAKAQNAMWSIYVRRIPGEYRILATIVEDDASTLYSAQLLLTDAPHWIEADFAASSGPGNDDGFARLWIDVVDAIPDASIENVDNDTRNFDHLRVGAPEGTDATTSGTFYIDYICYNDTGDPIGPPGASPSASLSPSSSPSPSTSPSPSPSPSTSPSASASPSPEPEYPPTPIVRAVRVARYPSTQSYHESIGLSIAAYQPTIGSYTPRGVLVDDRLGEKYSAYSHVTQADGGWWSAGLSLNGNLVDMEDWFERGLGRHIEVYNPALVQIWGGFVNKVTLSAGPLTATRGPLLDIANRVSVAYTPITDATTNPITTGDAAVTTIAENTASQTRYGIVEKVLDAGQLLHWIDTGPPIVNHFLDEQYRDTYLAENAWPKTSEDLGIGSTSEPRVELELLGYIHWLQAYIVDMVNIGDYDAIYISYADPIDTGKLQLVLGADPNGLFSTDYTQMDFNGILTSSYEDGTRDAWTIIKELVSMGDANNNRMLFGVYGGQQVYYKAAPTTTIYQHRMTGRDMVVEPFGGGMEIRPWDVQAGEWLFLPDFLAGRSQPSDKRRDPRYLFIESVTFTAPYSVQIRGGALDTLAQLTAKGGTWA